MAFPSTSAPSKRLDRWLPTSRFRESVFLRSVAPPERLLEAFEDVTLGEIPVDRFLGLLRGLSSRPESGLVRDAQCTFVDGLAAAGIAILESAPDEIVLGAENLVMSVRAVRQGAGETLLVFEHGTREETARLRFRDWTLMRPRAARSIRRLLGSVVRRAELSSQAARLRARKREESFLAPRPPVMLPTRAPGR